MAVSGGLLVYLIGRAEPSLIWAAWRRARPGAIALALLLQLLGVALSAAKWQLILANRRRSPPYTWLLATYLAGHFASSVIPTTIGGDALRARQLGRRIGGVTEAAASILVERASGLLALSLFANLALLLTSAGWGADLRTSPPLVAVVVGSALAVLAAVVAVSSERARGPLLRRLPQAVQRVSGEVLDSVPRGRTLAAVISLSFLFQASWVVLHATCGAALRIDAPLLTYVLLAAVTDLVGLAPVFFQGLGAREAVFAFYLSQLGVRTGTAVAFALVVFSVRLAVSCLGGLVVLLGGADFGRWSARRAPASRHRE